MASIHSQHGSIASTIASTHAARPQPSDSTSIRSSKGLQPLFVLVEDAVRGDITHPEVQYIFSDDDQEMLTAATLNAAEDANATASTTNEHRILIVDMAADGQSVTKVSSLSNAWQVTSTEVNQAPSWQGGGDTTSSNLMLKLKGMAVVETDHAIDPAASLSTLVAILDEELTSLETHMLEHINETDDADVRT